MKRAMLRCFLLSGVVLLFFPQVSNAQIWSEDFSTYGNGARGTANGTGQDNNLPIGDDWSAAYAGAYTFSVQGNVFTGTRTNSEGVWTSETIDISSYNYVEFSLDIAWNTLTSIFSNTDYIRVYYDLDGEGDVLIYELSSEGGISFSDGATTVSQVLKGSTLKITINVITDRFWFFGYINETITFDNISVNQIPTIYSLTNGNWNSTASWSYDDFGVGTRTSCGCTPSSSENVIIGNDNTINLNVNGTTSGIEVLSGSILQWTNDFDLNITRGGNVIIQSGGAINQNGRSADIDFEESDVINKVQVHDALNGLDLDRIRIRGSGGITLYFEGSGKINLDGDLLIGYSTYTNYTIINNFSGNFQIDQIRFNSTDNSFINQSGSEITANAIYFTDSGDDNNVLTNIGTLNLVNINFINVDFTLHNYGMVNMTGNFSNFGGSESINNYNGSTWNYSGNTTSPSGLTMYLNYGTNTFEYSASGDQVIIVPQDRYSNLVIDGGGTKTLAGNVSMSGTLTLTNGIIDTNGNTFTFLGNSATFSGGSASSYVDGLVAKTGNGDFTFPTGDGGIWARIGISNLTGSETFTSEYFASGQGDYSDVTTMNNVSTLEYWTLARSGSVNANVTLYFEDAGRSEITDVNDLVVAHYNGSQWEDFGASANSANSVTSNLITTFSPFTFGSNSNTANPLPVNLLSFDVVAIESDAVITWKTSGERDNDFFTVEKSTDGIEFTGIGIIEGNGTTGEISSYQYIDMDLASGVYYYRLKQTDFDGKYEYFRPDFVEIKGKNEVSSSIILYPNPVTTHLLHVEMGSLDYDTESRIEIIDINGRLIESFNINYLTPHDGGIFDIPLDQRYYQTGFYFLHLYLPEKGVIAKGFIIQ